MAHRLLLVCLSIGLCWGCGSSVKKELSPAESDALIEKMIENLDAPEARGRILAIKFLSGQGPKAEPALPRIKELADDKDPAVRNAAKEALEQLGE